MQVSFHAFFSNLSKSIVQVSVTRRLPNRHHKSRLHLGFVDYTCIIPYPKALNLRRIESSNANVEFD